MCTPDKLGKDVYEFSKTNCLNLTASGLVWFCGLVEDHEPNSCSDIRLWLLAIDSMAVLFISIPWPCLHQSTCVVAVFTSNVDCTERNSCKVVCTCVNTIGRRISFNNQYHKVLQLSESNPTFFTTEREQAADCMIN